MAGAGETVMASTNNVDYIFGFGSIMNTTTHAAWLPQDDSNGKSSPSTLPGVIVTLKSSFGYERQWNFRSKTGFTALGVRRAESARDARDINGVLFRVTSDMLPGFDRREVGYKKVRIPLEHLIFHLPGEDQKYCTPNRSDQSNSAPTPMKEIPNESDRIWIYVPLETHSVSADENHPLLQSYVDTVLQGCLEWGGEQMAEDFLLTTGGWSPFFLNDTPSSRRPWLFRKQYNTIDSLLQKYAEQTHYGDRKHPEEFASAFHRRMKGTWSIPRRNPNFTGREGALDQLHSRLMGRRRTLGQVGSSGGVVKVEVAGMGGVGKSQFVTEYCYRHFPSEYGLIAWFNAESIDSLVADYRQLLADMAPENDTGGTPSEDTDEILREVKTRLFRSQVPWLLVFDNLEDRKLLANFVPRGSGMKGHVLVTTRLVDSLELVENEGENLGPLILECLNPDESIELLHRSAGRQNISGNENVSAAQEIAEKLGHLPLALGMAAAYMRRCDVPCKDYLKRYVASEESGQSLLRHGKLNDYSLSVVSSLSLSLTAIERESVIAGDVLRLLCFLGPDQITKSIVRSLLASKNSYSEEAEDSLPLSFEFLDSTLAPWLVASSSLLLLGASSLLPRSRTVLVTSAILGSLSFAGIQLFRGSTVATTRDELKRKGVRRSSSLEFSSFSAVEYEQADLVWDILKSYSLLSVKDGKGNIHRLSSEALRISQSSGSSKRNIRICVDTMTSLWAFQAEVPETWRDALSILEHVKSVVSYYSMSGEAATASYTLKVAYMSIEAGVYSAMALNAFVEAQTSLELALDLLQRSTYSGRVSFRRAQAEAQHELGKIHRYHGDYGDSEQCLRAALDIYTSSQMKSAAESGGGEASILHELGVLETKKHNLDAAARFLQQALDMRRAGTNCDSDCAATLHQLASVHVARKPPALAKAKALLLEGLRLSRQIGQRAATLKQLARVTIRQGDLQTAEMYLEQALELYVELYGDNKLHINVAAVKFQQGALAMQRGQFEAAWLHFSECLRIRRHVYSYARPIDSNSSTKAENPSHLEVSCVLHELGRVAFAQKRYPQAMDTLRSEQEILKRVDESATHTERLFQAQLTNLTWMRKCAKENGDEDTVLRLASQKAELKRQHHHANVDDEEELTDAKVAHLQEKAIRCRIIARQLALSKQSDDENQEILQASLAELQAALHDVGTSSVERAVQDFRSTIINWMDKPKEARKVPILSACDKLRDVLRAQGLQVVDSIMATASPKKRR